MTKHIACGDLIEGCEFVASAESEEELLEHVAEHAGKEHDVRQVTPELAAKVRAAIRTR